MSTSAHGKEEKLRQLDELIDRLERRLSRTFNAWHKAKSRRKWMSQKTFTNVKLAEEMVASAKAEEKDLNEIPADLRRPPPIPEDVKKELQALNKEMSAAFFGGKKAPLAETIDVDEVAKAMIKQHIDDRKKAKARGRVATLKAKQAGDLRKMPLSGKAALAFIKKEGPAENGAK